MRKLVVDIDELLSIKNQMTSLMGEFENECTSCMQKIDETRDNFYTPASDYFREGSREYLFKQKEFVSNTKNDLAKNIDKIIELYRSLNDSIAESVRGKN